VHPLRRRQPEDRRRRGAPVGPPDGSPWARDRVAHGARRRSRARGLRRGVRGELPGARPTSLGPRDSSPTCSSTSFSRGEAACQLSGSPSWSYSFRAPCTCASAQTNRPLTTNDPNSRCSPGTARLLARASPHARPSRPGRGVGEGALQDPKVERSAYCETICFVRRNPMGDRVADGRAPSVGVGRPRRSAS